MKKPSISSIWVFPLVAIAILAGAFLLYYVPSINRHEAELNDRAFRHLAAVGDQLQNRIENFGSALRQGFAEQDLAVHFEEHVPDMRVRDCSELPAEARNQPDGLVLATHVRADQPALVFRQKRGANARCAAVMFERALGPFLAGVPHGIFDDVALTDAAGRVLIETLHTGIRVSDLAGLLDGREQTQKRRSEDRKAPRHVAARDDREDGLPSEDCEIGVERTSAFFRIAQASTVESVTLNGSSFRLYMVPIPLSILAGESGLRATRANGGPVSARLVLAGLIEERRFRSESLRVPRGAILTVLFILAILIALTWPLLKFVTMGSTERIARRAGVYYTMTMLATVALLTVLGIHLRYAFDSSETNRNLKSLAEAIDRHTATELDQAQRTLDAIMRSKAFRDSLEGVSAPNSSCNDAGAPIAIPASRKRGRLLADQDVPTLDYPYFDHVVFADSSGFQQIKWSVRNTPTPATRACGYPFFVETLERHFWYFQDRGPAGPQFRVDPLYSPNTGEYLAMISVAPESPKLSVASMITPLMSLIRPVLPPDYGFVVVDGSGKALFHSDAARNGRENLFDACGGSPELRAAVGHGQESFVDAVYLHSSHRFLVTPFRQFRQCPWRLVVFRDVSLQSTQHLESVVMFFFLTLAYFGSLLLAGGGALLMLRLPAYPSESTWPSEKRRGAYYHAAIALAVATAAFYMALFETTFRETMVLVYVIPCVSLLCVILKLRRRTLAIAVIAVGLWVIMALAAAWKFFVLNDVRWLNLFWVLTAVCLAWLWLSFHSTTETFSRWTRPGIASTYTAVGVCLLVLNGVLPCFAFFKIAHDYHSNLFVRMNQLRTVAALQQREARVKKYYGGVRLSNRAQEESRWIFLRRRLDDQGLDRYDRVFLNVGAGQLLEPRRRGETDEHRSAALPPELTWFASLIPYAEASATRQLAQASAAKWRWTLDGANRMRMWSTESRAASSPQTTALSRFGTRDRTFLSEEIVSPAEPLRHDVRNLLGVILLSGAMFFLLRSTVRKLFVLDTPDCEEWPPWPPGTQVVEDNFILMGLPHCGKSEMVRSLRAPRAAAAGSQRIDSDGGQTGVRVIDMADVLRAGKLDVSSVSESVVVLDHFSFRNDAFAQKQKLAILEQFVLRDGKKTVVVTHTHPAFGLSGEALTTRPSLELLEPGNEAERWARVLFRFRTMRIEGRPSVRNDEYYRVLWSTCSGSERVALSQVALDGWANHKNLPALEHLRQRGLLVREEMYRFADEGFRRFIQHFIKAEDRRRWHRQEGFTQWDGLRATFKLVALAGVAGALFLYQQEMLALLTSVVGFAGGAAKFISDLRGRKSGGADVVNV